MKIGWASRDFTPDRPGMALGQVYTRIARTALDPLTLTALAIEATDARDQAIIVSCDLGMVSDALQRAVRERLATRLPAVPPEKLILCATHTHTSLVIQEGWYTHPGGDVMTPHEGVVLVADRATEAAVEAWERRSPQTVRPAFGHAVVGHNRRMIYADGSSEMYGRTDRADFVCVEGSEDHSLDMLFAWDKDGRLTGILLVIPCPPQVDESLAVWSADYWHEVREELRARLGRHLPVVGLCAAAGDQSQRPLLYGREEEAMRQRRGVSERREIALRVADAVVRALACTGSVVGEIPFAHRVERLALATRRATPEDRAWATTEHERVSKVYDPNGWICRRLREIMASADSDPVVPFMTEIHALRLGEIAIATNPFELFLDYGLRIKARSPAAQTFVVQLASGTGWYLPTERAMRGRGYGGNLLVAPVGPEGGNALVAETLRMIQSLYQNPASR